MQRYRVTANTPFYIDRSPSGSIWLDKGEWESLKSVGLTKCLNRIFTAPWQDAIRQKESEGNRTQLYQDKLGEDLYQQIISCLLYTSPSPRDLSTSRMPSSA